MTNTLSGHHNESSPARFVGGLALEVEGDVGVTLAEVVKGVATVISAVGLGRIRDLEGQQIRVLAGGLAQHFHALAVGDRFLTLVPRYVRYRMCLQDALHDEYVALLADRRFLGEARRLTVRYSA